MDYHLKFRMDSMKQASSALGQPVPIRFRTNSTPMLFRSKCKPTPLEDAAGTGQSTTTEPAGSSEAIGAAQTQQAVPSAKDSPQVQKQVKQLQFWLKVFSRFCQDDTAHE